MWYDYVLEFLMYQYYSYFPPKPVGQILLIMSSDEMS